MTTNNKSYRSRNLTLALAGVTTVALGAFGLIANIGAATITTTLDGDLTGFKLGDGIVITPLVEKTVTTGTSTSTEWVSNGSSCTANITDATNLKYSCTLAEYETYILEVKDKDSNFATGQKTQYYGTGATSVADTATGVTAGTKVEIADGDSKVGPTIAKTSVHRVTFDVNGGTAIADVFSSATTPTAITLPTPALREGFVFDAWYTDLDDSTTGIAAGGTYTVNKPVKFIANWKAIRTVTFNLNGGDISAVDQAKLKASITEGEALGTAYFDESTASAAGGAEKVSLTKKDAKFRGWFTAATGGKQVDDTTKVTGNTTYYAQWNSFFTVTFDPTNGDDVEKVEDVVENTTIGEVVDGTIAEPSKNGHRFVGWWTTATSADGKLIDLDKTKGDKVLGNTTVYARWISNKAIITAKTTPKFDDVLPVEGTTPYTPSDIINAGFSVDQINAMQWMVNNGLSQDLENKIYNPSNSVLRESMALFMWRMAGAPDFVAKADDVKITDISDLSEDQQTAIKWLVQKGISVPGEDGKFNPFAPVLRESMALFMYRFAGSPVENFSAVKVNDLGDLDDEQRNAIRWMVAYGISRPGADGNFNPWNGVIRESMALFLQRTYNYLNN